MPLRQWDGRTTREKTRRKGSRREYCPPNTGPREAGRWRQVASPRSQVSSTLLVGCLRPQPEVKAAASPSEERPGGYARSTVAGRSQQPVLANACEKAVLNFTSDNTLEYSSLEQPVRTGCWKLEYSGVALPVKLQPVRTSCNLRTNEAVQTWLVGNAEVNQRSVFVDQRSPLAVRS